MITFDNIYDFYYKLTDEERENHLGEILNEENRYFLYLPVWLNNKWENYGKEIGLLIVCPPFHMHPTNPNWFKVGCFSPDDYDCDVCFDEPDLYEEVLDYVKNINKIGVNYKDLIFSIKEKFPSGKIYY